MLMIDLGVPRDIESEIGQLDDVYLYTLDDLQKFIQENKDKRNLAAQQAENIIDLQTTHFMRAQQMRSATPTIRAYREKMQDIRDKELVKALQKLEKGENPQQILLELSQSLLNKFLHQPTKQLRHAASHGQSDILTTARQLFDID